MIRCFFAVATIVLFVHAAHAQTVWREYVYADQQFAVSFPGPPTVAAFPVQTPDGISVTESIYSATLDTAHFQIAVFDLLGVRMNGATAVARAAYRLRERGEVKLDAVAEVQGNWGRDLEIASPDGDS